MVRETKRQYISPETASKECSTHRKITDEFSLRNWTSHFAVKLLNKLRIGRRWTKPMAQFGKKIWFEKIGEEGTNSTLKRRIQGTFVGQQDRMRTILYIAKNGGVGYVRP